MARKRKSKYKLYGSSNWSQWHGAQEQARRIIEEILPMLDEALQISEIYQTIENLSRYISEIYVSYSNISCVLKDTHQKIAKKYMERLLVEKRNILSKGVVTKDYYFRLHNCASNFDNWLRTRLQDMGLLYRIVKKRSGSKMLKDLMEYSNEKKVDDMIKKSPYLLSQFDLKELENEIKKDKSKI